MRVKAELAGPRFTATGEQHAHHTGWALDPEDGTYALTLLDEHDELIAIAVYSFEHWMECFDALKVAHALVTTGGKHDR
ncbi:MAG TPA: hypothetical protein VHT52_17445 [Stellaceae bacterium]|jgi:hypothetical protein|nr:hypothetical protein [Stellaceae bacterium]